jgi:fatty-acyl-CoA synthase
MRATILDKDGRYTRDARTGEIGTIVIHGPNIFDGYLDEKHNASIWVEIDGQKWLNTGDLGKQDAEGYFWLTGRSKELIIRGGHNIDPMLIEEPLMRHPDVQMAAAVARPDARYGELPVAYVQLRPGATVSEQALLEHAQTNIGERAAWPKAIRVLDRMPQTAVGKLFKPALKKMEIRDALLHSLAEAGLGHARLEVVDNPESGLQITVTVDSEQSKRTAESVLAQYAFSFRVMLDNQSSRPRITQQHAS